MSGTPVSTRMRKSTAETVPSQNEYPQERLSLATLDGNQCRRKLRTTESPASRSLSGCQVHLIFCQVVCLLDMTHSLLGRLGRWADRRRVTDAVRQVPL